MNTETGLAICNVALYVLPALLAAVAVFAALLALHVDEDAALDEQIDSEPGVIVRSMAECEAFLGGHPPVR